MSIIPRWASMDLADGPTRLLIDYMWYFTGERKKSPAYDVGIQWLDGY